jgi:hypothetical protein
VKFVVLEELEKERRALRNKSEEDLLKIDETIVESTRVGTVAHDTTIIIKDLDEEFSSLTKLDKRDVLFLFIATALQCVRQYVLTDFKPKVDHNVAAEGVNKYHSDRSHRWYNPSLQEVWANPVPFDTTFGSRDIGAGIGGDHRAKTLGHDPLWGWIFGTANIATSTLTDWKLNSYHVKTGYNALGHNLDKLTNHADTIKIFEHTFSKLLDNKFEGQVIIGASLLKEAEHLKSDIKSHYGLTFPGVLAMSPKFARELSDYGIDTADLLNVATQVSMAGLINTLIAMVHRLFYNESKFSNISNYEVKTRKILSYSNTIASVSNVIYVAVSSYLGNTGTVKKLDVGGFLVTIYRLILDYNFINKVKQEFIYDKFDLLIRGQA